MSLKLFKTEERQHSPSVFQLEEAAGGRKIVDFCYLSNKFFPTPELVTKLGLQLDDIVPIIRPCKMSRASWPRR